jgi:hypothetical protein
MNDSVRAYQRQLIRDRYACDRKVAEARYLMELQLAHGDGRLDFNKLPTQALVERLHHIFAMWRTK